MSTSPAGMPLVPATVSVPLPIPPSTPPLGPVPLYIAQRVGDFLIAPLTFTCPGVCPHSSCFLAVVRSFRQGVVYGAKIRFPHALVMTFLFRQGSLTDKANDIIQATYTHARTLGLYAATYKLLTCILRHITRQPNNPFIPLTAGMIGGGLLFGRSSPINVNTHTDIHTQTGAATRAEDESQPASSSRYSTAHSITLDTYTIDHSYIPSCHMCCIIHCQTQINMYVMSRVIFGLLRLATNRGLIPEWEKGWGYTVYAGLVWGLVMLLFECEVGVLQKSLANSMEYLYHNSDTAPRKGEGLLDWLVRE